MQKRALLKRCWVDDLYRFCFCLSPSPRLKHAIVSTEHFLLRYITISCRYVAGGLQKEEKAEDTVESF